MISLRLQTEPLDRLLGIARQMGKGPEAAVVGATAVANLTREHLFALDGTNANQMGGVRTHFYAAAAKSVQEAKPEGSDGASFRITKIGLAQRWLGGTIKAGQGTSSATGSPTKYLAIPARSETYGKAPGEFNDLQFVRLKRGRGMLVQALQTAVSFGRKKKDGSRTVKRGDEAGSLVMFWLVTQVVQKPDPDVMPSQEAMTQTAAEHIGNYLSRLLQTS